MDAHIRDLRYFVAVAEELSFTRAAAERLFISQPSLSRQIRQLELSLRAKLFERDRRTVALTAAGAALLPEARRIIEQWEGAQRAVAAAREERMLVVGFQTRIGRGLVPSISSALPGWDLRFRQVPWSDPTVGLGDGQVDVAVAWLPVPGHEYDWTVVSTEERWVALPADHPLAARPEVTLADLAGEAFVALPVSAGPMRDFWLAGDQRPAPAVVGAEAETAEEAFELVASGRAVVLVSAGNAELYRRDDVVSRPVVGLPPSRLAVVWRRGDRRQAVRRLVDAFVTCMCAA
ncbi:LysR family transcriptional regulator [Nonomuraea angiospora]|uniref:DNA-binding transcriptional LysR family regulator n=1 Tax=Nonomuraea angiospora TaxID=46172 RepID=A0ABR9MCN3_9ACTN|nr:LysR substrate-binding domain-containing protein [Nonomuraea angiospora]MBE1590662.1 DNA-binding transcriptional LysR family regulator [Nonomuraea angiospora]